MRNIKTVVLINLVLACLIIFTATNSLYSQFVEQEVFFDEFERTEIGNEYELRAPNWKIENGLLIHTGDGTFNPGFVLLKNINLETNFAVEVNVKWVQNGFFEDGVVVNYNKSDIRNSQNNTLIDEYIFSYLSSWNNRVSTYSRKIENNNTVDTDTSKSFPVNRNVWYKFKIIVTKEESLNKIDFYINDILQISTKQSILGDAVGLGGWKGEYGQVVHYDSLKVSKLQPDFTSGLVAYYPFNGNANDESGNSHNGTPAGSFSFQAEAGKDAIRLNGSGYVSSAGGHVLTPSFQSLGLTNKFTISVWVKEEGMSHEHGNAYFLFGVDNNIVGFSHTTGSPEVLTYASTSSPTVKSIYIDYPGYGGVYNQWIHHLLVYENDSLKTFKNGILTKNEQIVLNINSNYSAIGRHYWSDGTASSTRFIGWVDDFRVYNRALSDADVTALYEMEKPAEKPWYEQGLVAFYPFNGNADDASGNEFHGTVIGPTRTIDRFGKSEEAYSFDGINDFIDVSTKQTNLPESNQPHTISTWVLLPSISPSSFQNLLSWGTRSSNQRRSLGFYTNQLTFVGESNDLTGSINLNRSQWYQVTSVYDGTVLKLFVNGVLDSFADKALNTTGQKLRIGTIALPSNGEFFKGALDDIRIYNRALPADEVKALYEMEAVQEAKSYYISLNTNAAIVLQDTISISVKIGTQTPIDSLYTAAFKLNFDTTLVSFIPEKTQVGTFLGTNPISFFRNEAGTSFVDASVGATVGTNYSGTGELAKLYFLTKKVENAAFSLSEVQALTKSGTGRTLIPKDTTVRIVASNIDPVKNLRVTSAGNKIVTIAWDAHSSSDVRAYRIYRSDGIQSETFMAQVGSNQLTYSDNSIQYGTPYVFGVSAVTSYGLESPKTDVKYKSQIKNKSDFAMHLTFDGTIGDTSGNEFDMVGPYQGFITDRFGRATSAVSFDGAQSRLQTKRLMALDSTSFTLTFAEKKNTSNGHILTHGNEYSAAKFLHIGYTQDRFTVRFYANDITTTETFADGVWRHWMIVYNKEAKTRKLYLNNSLISSEENVGEYYGVGRLVLGSNFNFTNHYKGELDDIRLYTKALDENELKTIYETDNAPFQPSGLTAFQESNSIKLNWNRSKESDLAYYFIERQTGDGSIDSLSVRYPTESPDTAYTDFTIKGSQTYTYRITAVDTDNLKSEASATVFVTTEPNINDDMVAYYPFDGNTRDYSDFGNDLSISPSGVTIEGINRYGESNKAVEITSAAGFLKPKTSFNSSAITVSLWYKASGFSSTWNTLFCDDGGTYQHLLINAKDSTIGFYNGSIYPSTQKIEIGEWNHLVVIKNGTNSKIYVNGYSVQDENDSFNNVTNPLSLIGNFSSNSGNPQGALGTLDDIRIFKKALTEDEVKEIYKLESEGVPPNPPKYQATADDSLNSSISLSWLASTTPNVSLYRIYRRTIVTEFSKLVEVTPHSESSYTYNDTSITRGVTYFYEIKAVSNKGIESSPLVSTRSLDKLSSPIIKTVNYSKTSNAVDITWSLSQALDANFYNIYRKEKTDTTYNKVGEVYHASVSQGQFSDKTVEQFKVYSYSVSVTDKKGIESDRVENDNNVFVLATNKIVLASLKIDNESQNGKIKSKPTFKFNPVIGADHYKIRLTSSQDSSEKTTTDVVYKWPNELEKGASYDIGITPVFKIDGITYDGETVSKTAVQVYSYPSTTTANFEIDFNGGSLAKAYYRLVGFPGVIGAEISNWIPIQEKNTIMYSWNSSSFEAFSGTPESGKAYWLLSDKTREVSYNTRSVDLTEDSFELTVNKGWNLISNPFNETINWDSDIFLGYPVLRWTGYGYNVSTSLDPGKGYIWWNKYETSQILKIDYYALALPKASKEIPKENLQKSEKENPILHVFAKIGKAKESLDLQAVVSQSSTDTVLQKQVNVEVPPIPFEISTVYLPNDSLEQEKSFIRRLIRYQENGIRCLIKADFVDDEWVTWAYSFSEKQEDWESGLIDKQTAKWHPFTSDSVRLKLKKGEHEFVFVSGNQSFTDQVKLELLPKEFALHQNYPNPFNPITTIEFSLPESRLVRLEVFDIVGRNVSTLINTQKEAGFHSVQFNGSGLSSGVYLYRIQAGDFVQVKKLLLVK